MATERARGRNQIIGFCNWNVEVALIRNEGKESSLVEGTKFSFIYVD